MSQNTGQGYNFNNDRGRRIARWLVLIEQDQNYARILFRLPLKGACSREVYRAARRVGYNGKHPPRR